MIEQQLAPPILRHGDVMDADEFLRRWEAMPDLKKAELIEGVVHVMASPVLAGHSRPDSLLSFWLSVYAMFTPGVEPLPNNTFRLNLRNQPQPDNSLAVPEELGGQVRIDDRGMCHGAPELSLEVCSSQTHAELAERVVLFCRFGTQEFVALFPRENLVEWYDRRPDGSPELRPPPEDGVYRSRVFPGLWLDVAAALRGDRAALFAVVQAGCRTPDHAAFAATLAARATANVNPVP